MTVIGLLAALTLLTAPASLLAAPASQGVLKQLELVKDKSVLIDTTSALKRTSVTNPEIANVVVISPTQLLVNGNRTGTTNLIVWLGGGENEVYNITVSADTDLIKRRLDELIPRNTIRVSGAGDLIILSGEVDDIGHIEQAAAIAESLAAGSKGSGATPVGAATAQLQDATAGKTANVVNLIKVASLQQVMLEVTIAEVDRETLKEFGINAQYSGFDLFGLSNLGQVIPPSGSATYPTTSPAPNFTLSSAVGVMIGLPRYDVTGFIRALQSKGLVKILAEPSLITVSGERASFLAGGEFPVPVSQQNNSVAVTFREFGVRLNFTPTVLGSDKLSMKVAPEVSSLDFATAVTVGAFTIPGLKSRKADTTIELSSGQSFAIAGLINSEMTSQVDKFPILGDIPVLGALFRSTRFRSRETELLIVATPRLVRPLAAGKRPQLPGDHMRPPTDLELFLLGKTHGKTDTLPPGPWGFEK